MSKTEHTWHPEAPPAADVYTTRRNASKYLTLRYWDGSAWFEIGYSSSRGGKPFVWPKPSRSRRPEWAVRMKTGLYLRKIGAHQGAIQWGDPYKVYDEKEVIKHLVKTGRLPADWPEAFQDEMRQHALKGKP